MNYFNLCLLVVLLHDLLFHLCIPSIVLLLHMVYARPHCEELIHVVLNHVLSVLYHCRHHQVVLHHLLNPQPIYYHREQV